jgi:hypothetical protein
MGADLPGHVAGPGQERPPVGDCDAWRSGPRRVGPAACRVAGGRAGGRANSGLRAGMHEVQRELLVPRWDAWRDQRCGGPARPSQLRWRPAAVAESGDDAPDATGCSRVHRDVSRRNDDAGHATESTASSLHQIQVGHEVPGHRSRAVGPAGRGHRRAACCAAGSAC